MEYSSHQVMMRWFLLLLPPRLLLRFDLWRGEDLTYGEVKDNVRDIMMGLIEKEREGEVIERALMKNVVEMGMGMMDCYVEDFEALMAEKTGLNNNTSGELGFGESFS
ncbi:Cullin, N-terminal [Parasponia andersonii]|uniref:Cullin, N-terminal n=1 Tax=Parasponia andersonii TaxID=3476 RepID=A0A2P5D9Q8_PARAD|nr:Cullin, N-terminal [Parasponia andersonii]